MASFKDAEHVRWSRSFPAIIKYPFERTSDETERYNCFAYVAGETKRMWSPLPIRPRGHFWPVDFDPLLENTIWPLLFAYNTIGFEICRDGSLEDGIEKIAIYVTDNDEPKHAAIQREDGLWQSKLGLDIDIKHPLLSLESTDEFGPSDYGNALYFMARKRSRETISP